MMSERLAELYRDGAGAQAHSLPADANVTEAELAAIYVSGFEHGLAFAKQYPEASHVLNQELVEHMSYLGQSYFEERDDWLRKLSRLKGRTPR